MKANYMLFPYAEQTNWIKRVINILGGPTRAAHTFKVSNATIHNWIKARNIPNIDLAQEAAKLTGVDVLKLRRV